MTKTSIAVTALVLSTMLVGCSSPGATPIADGASVAPQLEEPNSVRVTALEAATEVPPACDRYIHIDGVGSGGEGTPEAALQAWLDQPVTEQDVTGAPPEAPRAGWRTEPSDREGYVRFAAGAWTVDAREGSPGQWTVTQQGCAPAYVSPAS